MIATAFTNICLLAQGDETSMMEILFLQCGEIGYVLWALSLVTLSVIIEYFISIRRANIIPDGLRARVEELFEKKQYRDVIELTADDESYLGYTINAALSEAARGYGAMERALDEAAEERTSKLLRKVEWLNLIGNVSPMLGLMGTVWGMIGAFFTIVSQGGSPDAGALAGDIGVALVTTLLGLAVAIPSMAVYGVMRNRIANLSADAILVAEDLISAFRPGGAKKTSTSSEQRPEQG